MNETMKMLQDAIVESEAADENSENRQNDIIVSTSEDENKLFWSEELTA